MKQGTRVTLFNIPDLSGMTGKICGKLLDPIPDFPGHGAWIILIDEIFHHILDDLGYEYTTLCITDACVRED